MCLTASRWPSVTRSVASTVCWIPVSVASAQVYLPVARMSSISLLNRYHSASRRGVVSGVSSSFKSSSFLPIGDPPLELWCRRSVRCTRWIERSCEGLLVLTATPFLGVVGARPVDDLRLDASAHFGIETLQGGRGVVQVGQVDAVDAIALAVEHQPPVIVEVFAEGRHKALVEGVARVALAVDEEAAEVRAAVPVGRLQVQLPRLELLLGHPDGRHQKGVGARQLAPQQLQGVGGEADVVVDDERC